jgi:hypothetical protein
MLLGFVLSAALVIKGKEENLMSTCSWLVRKDNLHPIKVSIAN